MSGSASAFNYRRLDLQRDLSALVGLLNEVEQTDHTGDDVTEATLSEQLTWSGEDPALNNWVVTLPDDTTLVAYGIVQKVPTDDNADLNMQVHPDWRRQGIGSLLLGSLLERAQVLHARAARAYVNVQNAGAGLFVSRHEFVPVSTYTQLRVSAQQTFPAPTLPPGFTTRSYDQVQRIEAYTEAMNRSYEGLWGHLQSTPDALARWLPQLNYAGIFLLFAPDGSIAGTCRATLGEDLATIDAPGVVSEYREADLYLPLLLTTIHWLLPQNPTELEIESWGDTPGTLALYRALGFKAIKEEISYRRDL